MSTDFRNAADWLPVHFISKSGGDCNTNRKTYSSKSSHWIPSGECFQTSSASRLSSGHCWPSPTLPSSRPGLSSRLSLLQNLKARKASTSPRSWESGKKRSNCDGSLTSAEFYASFSRARSNATQCWPLAGSHSFQQKRRCCRIKITFGSLIQPRNRATEGTWITQKSEKLSKIYSAHSQSTFAERGIRRGGY